VRHRASRLGPNVELTSAIATIDANSNENPAEGAQRANVAAEPQPLVGVLDPHGAAVAPAPDRVRSFRLERHLVAPLLQAREAQTLQRHQRIDGDQELFAQARIQALRSRRIGREPGAIDRNVVRDRNEDLACASLEIGGLRHGEPPRPWLDLATAIFIFPCPSPFSPDEGCITLAIS
jgi:hypothetical protein